MAPVGTAKGDQLVGVAAHLPPEFVHPTVVRRAKGEVKSRELVYEPSAATVFASTKLTT
jgi:hypothetical protein